MKATWYLNGTLSANVYCKNTEVLLTAHGDEDFGYWADIQILIERDFTGALLKRPEWQSVLDKPKKFSRLNDALDYLENDYKSIVYDYLHAGEHF